MRRILNQAAHAAIKVKGSIFEVVFQRLTRGLKYKEAIWAIAHRLCRLIWKLLHDRVDYVERGPSVHAVKTNPRRQNGITALWVTESFHLGILPA